MEMQLWVVLVISFFLGLFAAWISQFTVAKSGIEADAKAKNLRANVEHLHTRNKERRTDLKNRQEHLDRYIENDIMDNEGKLDDQALKTAIKEEKNRIAALSKTIVDSENLIVENLKVLAEIERKRALSSGWLIFISGSIGGVTALIFGFIGLLGGDSSSPGSLTSDISVSASTFIQSLLLGAGWPMVWEKLFSVKNLESTATSATDTFLKSVKEIETNEVITLQAVAEEANK